MFLRNECQFSAGKFTSREKERFLWEVCNTSKGTQLGIIFLESSKMDKESVHPGGSGKITI